jgi:hypothetical protein
MLKALFPLFACLLPTVALAQPRPMIIPQHDAIVTYHLEGSKDVPKEAKAYFQMGGGKVRIESDSLPGYILIDRISGKAEMMLPGSNFGLETPIGREIDRALNDPSASFRPLGPNTIAGVPCMMWSLHAEDAVGQGCVTGDGLILSAEGHNRRGEHLAMKARTVAETPLPHDLFKGPAQSLRLDSLAKFGRALRAQ